MCNDGELEGQRHLGCGGQRHQAVVAVQVTGALAATTHARHNVPKAQRQYRTMSTQGRHTGQAEKGWWCCSLAPPCTHHFGHGCLPLNCVSTSSLSSCRPSCSEGSCQPGRRAAKPLPPPSAALVPASSAAGSPSCGLSAAALHSSCCSGCGCSPCASCMGFDNERQGCTDGLEYTIVNLQHLNVSETRSFWPSCSKVWTGWGMFNLRVHATAEARPRLNACSPRPAACLALTHGLRRCFTTASTPHGTPSVSR